ncbi:MAG: sulfotransferase [Promethearchaeota archaeon]
MSGLPRSGTSMMMRMLEAGGVNIVVDNIRSADDDNPKGYYEDERVKKLKENNSWLDELKDKAVKIISLLLYHLPMTNEYKIIFMLRDMKELLISQKKMLERQSRGTDDLDDEKLSKKFKDHLEKIRKWLERQRHIECLYVDYHDVIQHPVENAERVKHFLNKDLNIALMAQAVDEKLYRNRRHS